MRSVPVVMMQPKRQVLGALAGGLVGPGIGPFPQCGQDEALGLAIGLWRVGLGAEVAQPQALAKPGEAPGFVASAVIGQDPPEGDAQRAVVAQGRQQGPAGASAALVGLDVGKGDSRMVIKGDMDEFPTRPGRVLRAIPGGPMSRSMKAPELLDVEMEHVARCGVLITHDGCGRFECRQAVESCAREPASDGALADPALLADLAIRLAAAPLLDHLVTDGRRQGMRAGPGA